MIELSELDRKILALAQGDLDICERPFDGWAEQLGISVDELLERLRELKRTGVIRDFKAILRHQRSGFRANAMVTWAVPPDDIDRVGYALAESKAVTHCYERPAYGRYSIFSMVHGRSREELEQIVKELAGQVGIDDYQLHWSERELKKTSMQYF